jgi:hypothetical protein
MGKKPRKNAGKSAFFSRKRERAVSKAVYFFHPEARVAVLLQQDKMSDFSSENFQGVVKRDHRTPYQKRKTKIVSNAFHFLVWCGVIYFHHSLEFFTEKIGHFILL